MAEDITVPPMHPVVPVVITVVITAVTDGNKQNAPDFRGVFYFPF